MDAVDDLLLVNSLVVRHEIFLILLSQPLQRLAIPHTLTGKAVFLHFQLVMLRDLAFLEFLVQGVLILLFSHL